MRLEVAHQTGAVAVDHELHGVALVLDVGLGVILPVFPGVFTSAFDSASDSKTPPQ